MSGIACCAIAESLTPGTVAALQYNRPPMSGGEGVSRLASSHALTSRITPDSGLAGRGGTSSKLVGTGGTTGNLSRLVAAPNEGAVRGRLRDVRLCTLSPSPLHLKVCRDVTFRRFRRSHFFAVSCLLSAAELV
jgi:hypothetical protein